MSDTPKAPPIWELLNPGEKELLRQMLQIRAEIAGMKELAGMAWAKAYDMPTEVARAVLSHGYHHACSRFLAPLFPEEAEEHRLSAEAPIKEMAKHLSLPPELMKTIQKLVQTEPESGDN